MIRHKNQQMNMFQMKEQDKTTGEEINEVQISNLLDKEFKVMIIKMHNKLERRMDEYSEKIKKGLEHKRKEKSRAEE